MSNNSSSRTTARAVSVRERRALHVALQRVDLTREEELVLRLRHGIPVPRSTRIEYRGQQDPELAIKLAVLEADALDHLRGSAEAEAELEGQRLESAIIDELRKI